jgi:hypothetical protein
MDDFNGEQYSAQFTILVAEARISAKALRIHALALERKNRSPIRCRVVDTGSYLNIFIANLII